MSLYYVENTDLTSFANAVQKKNKAFSIISYPEDYINAILTFDADYDVSEFFKKNISVFESDITNNLVSIPYNAFYNFSSLTSVSFPVCEVIGDYAFLNCSALTTVNFSACTTISSGAFYSCSALTTAVFSVCTTIGSSAFYSCYNLTTASFPACTTIGNSAFYTCYALMSLYLLGSSYVTMQTTALYSTPMSDSTYTGTFGSIYVPASMLESYKTRVGFSAYSDRLVGVET